MANDFSSEASVKALWRFESGALTTDSKGTNTLTAHNTPAEDTTDYKEGACAVALVTADADYFNIPDANLDSGFPFKSGDTTKLMSVCLHFKGTSFSTSNRHIIGKWSENGKRSWILTVTSSGQLRFYYSSDGSTSNYYSMLTLTANRWYHIGFAVDGVNKRFYCRLVDESTGTAYYYYPVFLSTVIAATNSDLQIGCVYDSSGNPKEFLSGKLDEIVVFDRLIAFSEMEKIRLGTYDGSDGILVSQVGAEIEYLPTPQIQVSQLFAQVEWVPTDPNVHVYAGSIPISIAPQGNYDPVWTKTGQVVIGVAPQGGYFYNSPGEFEYHGAVGININPQGQYQRGFSYRSPGIGITVSLQADYLFPDHFYESLGIEITVTPTGAYRIPIPGWDIYTGYGLVDFSWLSEDPPFYVILGNIPLAIDPTARDVSLIAEDQFDINPALKVGGRTAVVHSQPGELLVETQGGLAVGGEPLVEWPEISVGDYTARVEILLSGSSSAQHIIPSYRDVTVETRGGVRLTGSTSPVYLSPQDLITEFTTVVSAKVGPVRVPQVEFIEPELDVEVLELTTQVALEVSGAPLVDYPELPTVFEHETKFGKIRVSGACGVLWDYPEIFDHVAVGGVVLAGQGEEAEEFFYTIALHGYTFEPSLYSNFPFNSYAIHRGRVLAARDDGIYVLEGADDDGQAIHPGVRIGPTSFGLDNYKRLRRLHLGDCGEAEVRVAGVARGGEGYYRKSRERYEVGREVEDKVFIVEISDFTRLEQTQFDLIVLANR
jgi:hypothetical protein